MTFVQVRINQEEGSFDGYYNYEFALVCEDTYSRDERRICLDFDGPERYEPDEDTDREYEEDRTGWTIPSNEVQFIFTED